MTQKHQYFTEVRSTPIYNSQRENTVTEGRDRAVLANVTQRRINTPHPLSPRTRTNRTARAAENLDCDIFQKNVHPPFEGLFLQIIVDNC